MTAPLFTYHTIENESRGIFRDRGSRFIAIALPVTSYVEIKEALATLRKEYHDARHHCFAWMLGADRQTWRVSDDGEPSGTAGRPILGQINSYGLTNILIVVIRYFGGTLLGTSGLINAYRSAAADALTNATVIERHLSERWRIIFPYSVMNDVMRVLREEDCRQAEESYSGSDVTLEIEFRSAAAGAVTGRLGKIAGVTAEQISADPTGISE